MLLILDGNAEIDAHVLRKTWYYGKQQQQQKQFLDYEERILKFRGLLKKHSVAQKKSTYS